MTVDLHVFERQHMRFAIEIDLAAVGLLEQIVDIFGDDWLVFASDYSHFDSRWPGAAEPIVNHPKLSATTKRKILNDNARRLYPLE